jgi:outer membrane immunogenic protein
MRLLSSLMLGFGAVLFFSTTGLAADLPRKAPAYVPPAPPPYVWTGCYVGANVGGAWANVEVTDVATGASASRGSNAGFAGGGQIGCDYQMGSWVIGFRNIFDGTSVNGSRTFTDPLLFTGGGTVDTKVQWFDALTARGGYLVQPNLLFYVQGGAAWTQAKATAFNGIGAQLGSVSGNSNTGWTVGGGVEWMFVPHWSVFVEYNFMGFGTRSNAFQACGLGRCDIFSAKADVQNALIGVNYRF